MDLKSKYSSLQSVQFTSRTWPPGRATNGDHRPRRRHADRLSAAASGGLWLQAVRQRAVLRHAGVRLSEGGQGLLRSLRVWWRSWHRSSVRLRQGQEVVHGHEGGGEQGSKVLGLSATSG